MIIRMFFDIETKALPNALDIMPEPKAPANLKDPAKIAAHIAEKKAEQIANAALDPDLASVEAISWFVHGFDPTVNILGDSDLPNECNLIRRFWEMFNHCQGYCVGYNILGFDLPFLLRRSFALGIKPGRWMPNLAKFRVEPVTDLYAILYGWGPGKGLKWISRRYGLKNLVPDLDGSQVATMDRETLRRYSMSDLDLVRQLYDKMNGIYFTQ